MSFIRLSCQENSTWGLERLSQSEEGGGAGGLSEELLALEQGELGLGRALVWLISKGIEEPLEPGFSWLREQILALFTEKLRECSRPSSLEDTGRAWSVSHQGSQERFLQGKESLPLIQGAEYVTEALWTETERVFLSRIESERRWQGLSLVEYAERLHSHWVVVGRLVLHLAELPQGGERPFAFLATYAEAVSSSGKPLHVPLLRFLSQKTGQEEQKAALLSSLRQASEKSPWLKAAIENKSLFKACAWSLGETYAFLQDLDILQKEGILTQMPAFWGGKLPSRVSMQMTVGEEKKGSSAGGSLWSFSVKNVLDGEDLTPEEWARIEQATTGLLSLRGKWIQIDQERRDTLLKEWRHLERLHREGFPLSVAMRLLVGWSGMGKELSGQSEQGLCSVQAGRAFKEALQKGLSPEKLPESSLLKATLRPYQEEGSGWLFSLYQAGWGACLSDDMGLGKTVQVIAFLSYLYEWGQKEGRGLGASLIVAPLSLLYNWQEEFLRFAPHLKVTVFHGPKSRFEARHPSLNGEGADIIITTYAHALKREEISQQGWEVLVFDEAQQLKNPLTAQAQAMKALAARMKIALSGTPIENGLKDLWSLMDILNPGLLGESYGAFARGFEALPSRERYSRLKRLMAPFLLRRLKSQEEISLQLPPKTLVAQYCPLTHRQAYLYAHLVEELKKHWQEAEAEETLWQKSKPKTPSLARGEKSGSDSSSGSSHATPRQALILSYMMKFKQLCNHPSLLNGDNAYEEAFSSKFIRLRALAQEWALRQQKVLVFTQFREMIVPLMNLLSSIYGRAGVQLHGGMNLEERKKAIALFQNPQGAPFFVLSLKAAGTGLNLTEATHVVHFDRWWNPAVENQASDRAYRLGQKKAVFVHQFLIPGTVEERIARLLEEKALCAEEFLSEQPSWEKRVMGMNAQEVFEFFSIFS